MILSDGFLRTNTVKKLVFQIIGEFLSSERRISCSTFLKYFININTNIKWGNILDPLHVPRLMAVSSQSQDEWRRFDGEGEGVPESCNIVNQ